MYMYIYVYYNIKFITNTPTRFGASVPSSGSFDIAFTKVHHHHHHKHQSLDPLIRSVCRVTAARAKASLVFQLFSFLVVCSGMISKAGIGPKGYYRCR